MELFGVNIEQYVASIFLSHAALALLILFVIIFCETGVLVAFLLPGDSLLIASGFAAAAAEVHVGIVLLVLTSAAFLGYMFNYWFGARVGPRFYHRPPNRFINPKNLQKTHEFWERHGGKTILIARFVPGVRTFAPFVAGIAQMNRVHFQIYNAIGAAIWVVGCVSLGYFADRLLDLI